MIEHLLEEKENQFVHYHCIASEDHRYDIVVIHSERFFGKAMVVSIQTGRMVLLCQEDISDSDYWAEKLGVHSTAIDDFKDFFYLILEKNQLAEQY